MYKKILFIIVLVFSQNFTYNNANPLAVELTGIDLFTEKQAIQMALIITGLYTFSSSANYYMEEHKNNLKTKTKYIVPGSFMCTGIALLLLSPKISSWFVKK